MAEDPISASPAEERPDIEVLTDADGAVIGYAAHSPEGVEALLASPAERPLTLREAAQAVLDAVEAADTPWWIAQEAADLRAALASDDERLDVPTLAEAMKYRRVEHADGDYTAVPPTPEEVAAEYERRRR